MKANLILFFCSFALISCGQNNPATSEYYSNNEDKFSFLVFDAGQVDSFFRKHTQLEPQSKELSNAFLRLAANPGTTIDPMSEKKYAKHTDKPDPSDSALAFDLLKEANRNNKEYFLGNLNHLFLYECLPKEFQYKWVQGVSGGFEFNVTFFNLLRKHCKTFDEHIYGLHGQDDENIRKVFGEFALNEIAAQKAKEIKACMLQANALNDSRLQPDKEHFLEFLDKVVTGKWRIFLCDWD